MYSEEEYYHKADNLIRISCQAVQGVFRDRWKRLTATEWSEKSAQIFIKGDGKAFYDKSKSIQKRLLREGNLEEWDLTLLSGILRALKSKQGGDAEQRKSDNLALQALCSERNKLAHNAQKKITEDKYQDAEHAIRGCLLTLGVGQDKIEKLISHAGVTSSVAALEQARKIQKWGDSLFSNKKYHEAIKCYEDALQVPSLLPVNLGTLLEKKANCYLALGKSETVEKTQKAMYAQALTDIEQALEHNECSWTAHSILAKIYKATNNMEKAIEHFTRALAISPGQADLKLELDDCKLLNGQMTREDHMDPLKMPASLEEITDHYAKASGVKLTPEMFLKAQKAGDNFMPGHSDVQTGHRYANGWSCKQDYQEAARHYTKAMNRGNAEGIYNLAILYSDGKGVQRDINYSLELLKRAANMPEKVKVLGSWHVDVGVRAAQHSLGLRYDEGIGVGQDYSKAAHWYTKAAAKGCGNAANNLGVLYYNGRGVKKDLKMAEMYWRQSVERGNTNAAFSLCTYYTDELEPKLAKLYLEKAIQLQHNRLPYIKDEIESRIEMAAKTRAALEEFVVKYEQERGLTTQGLTFRQRNDRMMVTGMHEMAQEKTEPDGGSEPETASSSTQTEAKDAAENLAKLLKSNPFSFFQREQNSHMYSNDNTVGWAGMFRGGDFDEIAKRADEGSVTAQRVMAVIGYNEYFLLLWNEGPPFSSERAKNLMEFVYRRCCMEHHIAFMKSLEMQEEFKAFLTSMFETHCRTNSELDKKVRLCYAFHVKDKGLQYRVQILKEGIRRYPNERTYYYLLSSVYGDLNKNDLGLEVANQGLQRFPDYDELLYCKAVHTRLTQELSRTGREIIEVYQDFLRVAPEDHRKVPEAYYCIASKYLNLGSFANFSPSKLMNMDAGSEKKMREYYERGLQAEKVQLPCYLPYESTTKTTLQPIMFFMSKKPRVSSSNSKPIDRPGNETGAGSASIKRPVVSKVLTESSKDYLKDPKRIQLIKGHRERQKTLRKAKQFLKERRNIEVLKNTVPPKLQHKLPKNLCNLTEITLQEMDPTEDTVYEKKILNLTLIDEPIFGLPSINLVAMDDNKEVTRVYVYNVPQNEEMREKLGFGCRLTIVNPYRRRCADWTNAIRIDEPKCIVFMEKVENMCRYCGEENAQNKCSKCKWARYCSKDCQTQDWYELDHKLICRP